MLAVELFWIITAWPNGAGAITFAAIVVLLASPRADEAYANAMSFMVGVGLAAAFAAIIEFAVLQQRLQRRAHGRRLARQMKQAARPWASFALSVNNCKHGHFVRGLCGGRPLHNV